MKHTCVALRWRFAAAVAKLGFLLFFVLQISVREMLFGTWWVYAARFHQFGVVFLLILWSAFLIVVTLCEDVVGRHVEGQSGYGSIHAVFLGWSLLSRQKDPQR